MGNREEKDLAERKQRAYALAEEIRLHADQMIALAQQLQREVSSGGGEPGGSPATN